MDLSHLRAARPDLLSSGFVRVGQIRDGLAEAGNRLRVDVGGSLAEGWEGQASQAAQAHIERVQEELARTAERVTEAGRGLARFADAVAEAQELLASADNIAARARLTIGKDGSISFPASSSPLSEADERAMRSAAGEAHDLVSRAVAVASKADAECATALAAVGVSEPKPDGIESAGRALPGLIPSTGDEGGDDSTFGSLWEHWTDSDLSIWERVWTDPTGGTDWFGDLEQWEEDWISESPIGATPDELFGEEVVDRVHEEGLAALPDAMWDDWYESATELPGDLRDDWDNMWEDAGGLVEDVGGGLSDLADDPMGTVGGWLD